MQAMTVTVNPQKRPPVPPSVSAKRRFLEEQRLDTLGQRQAECLRKDQFPGTNQDSRETEDGDEAEVSLRLVLANTSPGNGMSMETHP